VLVRLKGLNEAVPLARLPAVPPAKRVSFRENPLNRAWADAHLADIGAAMKRVAKTIKGYATGILNYYEQYLTNGYMEGINSLIQAAKAKARGYRNVSYMKTIICLMLGKLNFKVPT
jgi:hypothetical protein